MNQDEMCVTSLATRLFFFWHAKNGASYEALNSTPLWLSFLLPKFLTIACFGSYSMSLEARRPSFKSSDAFLWLFHMYGLLTKCEVKMAGYWPSSFFACLCTETKSRSINSQKKNEANIQPS